MLCPMPAVLCGAPPPTAAARPRPELRVRLDARRRTPAQMLGPRRTARLVTGTASSASADGPPLGPAPPRRRGRGSATVGGEAEQAESLARRRRAGNAGEPAWAEPLVRKRRAPKVGVLNEKTADGKPKPDERTVADLVRRGWFESEEAAVALLTRAKSRKERFPFETAGRAADWLEATLGPEPMKDGLCPAVKAVKGYPELLCQDAAALQRKWDVLTLSPERGGVGIALSTEQACKAVCKQPHLLGFSVETYKAGWSMLLSIDGLDQTPEEARECIVRDPQVLLKDNDNIMLRVVLLKSLGYADARNMVLTNSRVLSYQEETVRGHAAWWMQTGLDHVKLVTAYPTLLGVVSVEELQAKLDFLRRVAGMSIEELNKSGPLLAYSLDNRLRARYFYALQKHRLARFGTINTMMKETDATVLAMMQGETAKDRASKAEVARYQKLVASAGFVAWRKRQEARLLRSRS